MKVLITGGAGLLGQNLIRTLLDRGDEVFATEFTSRKIKTQHPNLTIYTDCNLKDYDKCLAICEDMDIIIHAAAYIRGAKGQLENPISLVRNNLYPTMNIMEAACERKVPKFAFVGSSTMYPNVSYPVKESEGFDGEPPDMYTGVGWWKRYTEKMAMYYHSISSTKFAMVRTTAMYGPYDIFDVVRSHVIPSLIMKGSRKDDPFEVWGDGTQVRDFVFIEDFIEGLLLTIENHAVADPINIASGTPTSVKDLVGAVVSAYNYSPTLNFDSSKPTMIHTRLVDVSKALGILGWKAKTSLSEGIKKAVEWYEKENTI
jgi:GDP-L-fucose synthase